MFPLVFVRDNPGAAYPLFRVLTPTKLIDESVEKRHRRNTAAKSVLALFVGG
jgi:hypothetical protein